MVFGKLKDYNIDRNKISIMFEKQKMVLSVITPSIINVFVPLYTEEHFSKAVEGDKTVPAEFEVTEENGVISVTTSDLMVKVSDDFKVDFYRTDGSLLVRDYRGQRKEQGEVSEMFLDLLEAEGHDTSKLFKSDHKIMLVKELDDKDCIYGMGDKSGFLNKRNYEYENWNSDIPQAHNEDYHALYKSIPFMICLKEKDSYGIFFDNTFRSFMNMGKESSEYYFYGAEDGNIDYYFMGGETPAAVIGEYTYLTGRTPLPMRWTLGYHQSRWGYKCASDIRGVLRGMRNNQIPCDSIHFDIDYMDNYKVFTWNEAEYGPKGELFKEISEEGIKPIVIIDPGTKVEKGYFMCDEGVGNNYFAKDSEGRDYINEVWPGESHYPDFGQPEVRKWWSSHHQELVDWGVKGVWNDMNEPASFKGELPDDVVFHDEDRVIDHTQMHNMYGHLMSKATFEGLKAAKIDRPFVITRACYAGSQKYTTVWTGDNQSLWSHLQMMVPQLCNLGMSGFAFCGTDIGGFGADTTSELLTRWIEAACFSPLFRNHSSMGSKRQEPWLFGEKTLEIYKKYVELRYKFIPYIYDLFYQGLSTGLPVMRPLVLHYPWDENVRNLNGEFLVGENLLVAPVLEQGVDKKMVYLPEGKWYDYWTGEITEGGKHIIKDAPIDVCPIYIKAGSIIPMYDSVNYVGEKPYDKLILLVAGENGEYVHFQDNGEDNEYLKGEYNLYEFKSEQSELVTTMLHEGYEKYKEIEIIRL